MYVYIHLQQTNQKKFSLHRQDWNTNKILIYYAFNYKMYSLNAMTNQHYDIYYNFHSEAISTKS